MSKFKEQIFNTDISQKATIHREDVQSEVNTQANALIRELGEEIKPVKGIDYLGSAVVHIYKSPKLDQLFFQSQVVTLGNTPEVIASKAITDLRGSCMEYYGRKRPVKRSGF